MISLLCCTIIALFVTYFLIRPHYQFSHTSFDVIASADSQEDVERSLDLIAALRLEEQLGKVSSAEAQRIIERVNDSDDPD